jgi:hypothetical protein
VSFVLPPAVGRFQLCRSAGRPASQPAESSSRHGIRVSDGQAVLCVSTQLVAQVQAFLSNVTALGHWSLTPVICILRHVCFAVKAVALCYPGWRHKKLKCASPRPRKASFLYRRSFGLGELAGFIETFRCKFKANTCY